MLFDAQKSAISMHAASNTYPHVSNSEVCKMSRKHITWPLAVEPNPESKSVTYKHGTQQRVDKINKIKSLGRSLFLLFLAERFLPAIKMRKKQRSICA